MTNNLVRLPVLLSVALCGLWAWTTPRPAVAQNVRTVKLRANDIVYDAKTRRIFASVPSSEGRIGNSIIRLDPATGGVGPAVFIGSEPGKLALSSGSQFLYVALDGAAAVRRYDMATQTAGLQFALGRDSFAGPYYAGDIAAVPGSPGSIAVNRVSRANSSQVGVAIYDNGVPRPGTLPYPSPNTDSLAFASPTRLYAYENSSSGNHFFRLNVSSSGVALQDSVGGVISGSGTILFDGGLIFSTNGQTLNPETRALVGRYSLVGTSGPYAGPAAVANAASNRIFFLTQKEADSATIVAYDRTTFLPVGALVVPGVSGAATSLIRWGERGLAFRTHNRSFDNSVNGGQLFFIDSDDLPGLQAVTLDTSRVIGGAAATGTVLLTKPAPPVGVRVQLESSNPQAAGVPLSVLVPAGKTSATFTVASRAAATSVNVAVTATWGAQSRQSRLGVLNSAGTPVYGPQIRTMSLQTGDLAYDGRSGKIWASLPSAAGGRGNSITAIDFATATYGTPVFMGSEPGRLALSDGGQFLFTALDGAGAVRPFDTIGGITGPPFSLGNVDFYGARYVKDMAAVPGSPRSVAISRIFRDVSSDFASVAIYDSGRARPNATSDTNPALFLAFGASAARLYGAGNSDFLRMNVSGAGVSNGDQVRQFVHGVIKFDSGLLYDNQGDVVNPETLAVQGTFAGVRFYSQVVPDGLHGKVYFLTEDSSGSNDTVTLALRTYDARTFRLLDSFPIPDVYGMADSLTLCGPNRFAFRTFSKRFDAAPPAGQVYLIDLSGPPTLGTFTFSPAVVRVGSTTVATVTLTGLAPAGGATVVVKSGSTPLGNIVLEAGQTTGTLTLTAHVPGSYTVSATLNGVTKTAPLTVTP